ncbi:MAG: hypothetical protein KME19_03730 [Microcoleus vaginatus WJT46-NPBG5]|jgi:hypothetical protein|nr:hypothetical protein [Microcoleus vaginatus WJT46-NPBG5]
MVDVFGRHRNADANLLSLILHFPGSVCCRGRISTAVTQANFSKAGAAIINCVQADYYYLEYNKSGDCQNIEKAQALVLEPF